MKTTRLATCIAAAGIAAALSPAWAAHAPTVTEFSTPTPDSLA